MDVTKISDEDLKAELERREKVRREEEARALRCRQAMVAREINTLLHLHPEHDRNSCSDENACNSGYRTGRVRCVRCCLLDILRNPARIEGYDISLVVTYKEGGA